MTGILEPLAGTAPAVWEALDDRFAGIRGDSLLERLWTGGRWVEGPVYSPAGRYLLWSDIPNDRILRWDETSYQVSVFRQPAGNTNGHTLDTEGRLVSCEHGNRRVTRTEHHGAVTVLAVGVRRQAAEQPERRGGQARRLGLVHGSGVRDRQRLRGVQGRDRDGWLPRLPDLAGRGADPGRRRLQPAERPGVLARRIVALHHRLGGGRRSASSPSTATSCPAASCSPSAATGSSTASGSTPRAAIWASAADGVHIYHPDGTLLGKLLVPETVSNLTWGGAKRNRLFLTATTSLYSLFTTVNGAPQPYGPHR